MKTIFFAFAAALLLNGCVRFEKTEENQEVSAEELSIADQQIATGKTLFESTGNCFACHKPDQKIIGPSIAEIAKIYKDKNGDIVEFLKGKADPIVDPSQFEVMKTNFAITKNMSDSDLKALEAYIYSNVAAN